MSSLPATPEDGPGDGPVQPRPAIRLLDDVVINKIAAGEVVERPASVVKELIENALDAGATYIDVEIVDGGRKLIAVADNGCGMTHDELLLALERHATSKIRQLADLDHIRSMGFRGEALAAIPSVSRFTLRSRVAGQPGGTEAIIHGGTFLDVKDAGCPVGTMAEVRNLFYNVPARRKFLRTNQTETGHIRQLLHAYALAFPAVGWRLTVDGREDMMLCEGADEMDRLRQLFDRHLVEALRRVEHADGNIRVEGFAALPTCHRADRSGQYVFVNRRPAGAPLVSYAIQRAYEHLLPKGRHPLVFLFLDVAAGHVDVNAHPTKKEVRFRSPGPVRDAIIEALRRALGQAPTDTAPPGDTTPSPADARPFKAPPRPIELLPDTPASPALPSPHVKKNLHAPATPTPPPAGSSTWSNTPEGTRSLWGAYRMLGMAGGRYAVLETDEGVVLLDPQASHERILFERLMRGMENRQPASQRLLTPEPVTLPPAEAQRLRKHLHLLEEIGFGISEFGGNTLLVDALPACFKDVAAYSVLSEVVTDLERGGGQGGSKRWTAEMIARAASRTVTRGDRPLSMPELRSLIRELAHTEMPYTCPHGRPTAIFMSFSELDKKFGH